MNAGACTSLPSASSSAAPVVRPNATFQIRSAEQRRHADQRGQLRDALDAPRPCVRAHAGTMNTGVPTSTRWKSHSTCGISIRMQPCEAE